MLDWLVIGGGPHGVHVAARLIGEVGVPRERIRILDDEVALLSRWRRCALNTGMRYLRSPAVHHLDVSSASLRQFVNSGPGRRIARPFTRPYSRPSVEVFDRHSDEVITRHALQDLHVRGRANALEILGECVRVGYRREVDRAREGDGDGDGGGDRARGRDRDGAAEIEARHVVLALGAPGEPEWPDWARAVAQSAISSGQEPAVQHVFDPGFDLEISPQDDDVAVVGAGISGAQVAVRLADAGKRVFLLSRHALRIHQFDSDPGWQGPKYMAGFSSTQDLNERRRRIGEARHRGSIPPDVHSALRQGIAAGRIEHVEGGDVESAHASGGRVSLDLGGRVIDVDRVLLATGFPNRRPGEGWLDEAIEAHGLPCAECGYPIVDRGLRWHPRVMVTGALAELEIGPVARNLSGAMRAGERIAAVAQPGWVC